MFPNEFSSVLPALPAPWRQTAITSKDKRQGFGPFADVYEEAYGVDPGGGGWLNGGDAASTPPPPTFIVPLLHPHFLGEDGEGVSPR